MKNLLKFLFFLIFLYSCSSKEEQKVSSISVGELETQMIDAYKEGMKELEKGDVIYASRKFNEAELLYPQSEWASKSILMAAYAFYSQNYYERSILELERFISKYPKHKNIDYAHFLYAMCYYENIIDEKKDLEPLMLSKKRFQFIVKNYPDTDFALDSQYKINLINDVLASKEMYLGKYYIKKKKWAAAINRFKNVLENYETTVHVEEAIHRLVEIYFKLGMEEESLKYASLLGYNYNSGEWYEETYKIFNKKYKVSIPKNKKEKSKILSKIKDLF